MQKRGRINRGKARKKVAHCSYLKIIAMSYQVLKDFFPLSLSQKLIHFNPTISAKSIKIKLKVSSKIIYHWIKKPNH